MAAGDKVLCSGHHCLEERLVCLDLSFKCLERRNGVGCDLKV